MNGRQCPSEDKAGAVGRRLLGAGLVTSLGLEVIGMALYYVAYGDFGVTRDGGVFVEGSNFFSFVYGLFASGNRPLPLLLMTLGAVVLMVTPYLRVILSALNFVRRRDPRLLAITLFVLAALTVSLALH